MNGAQLTGQLTKRGLDEGETARKRVLFDLVLEQFAALSASHPAHALWVPGRIEIFGRHTDYAGGRSLVGAVPRGFVVVAQHRDDGALTMVDAVRAERFALQDGMPVEPAAGSAVADTAIIGWRRYALTTVRRLAQNFPAAPLGADIVFASDLPPASGMSSSSALMIGLAATLVRLAGIDRRPEWKTNVASASDAAGYYACIENGMSFGSLRGDAGVGTHGGSEDHVAILGGAAHLAAAWSFVPIRHLQDVRTPDGWTFVITSSGVAAKKTGAAKDSYNRLSRQARALLELWNASERPQASLAAALASDGSAVAHLLELIRQQAPAEQPSGSLAQRLHHFVHEDARVVDAIRALQDGDRARIAELSDASQRDAALLLQNQVPETIALARSARELGAFGASSFGAGFGGSVWALVGNAEAADFAARWLADYRAEFPARETATTFVAPLSPGLTLLS